jgi:hypothetical protein
MASMSDHRTVNIPSIKDNVLIAKVQSHLNPKNDKVVELLPPQSRAPPQISLFE